MLNILKRYGTRRDIVTRLCEAVSARSRESVFFCELRVADTIDGRFDLLALHAWLVMDELHRRQEIETGQKFVEVLFVQFDEALRELGAGDIGMTRRIKKMASAFFGRLHAYREASDESSLAAAIVRNLYRGAQSGLQPATALAAYCFAARGFLAQSRPEAGQVHFGPLPIIPG